jgi:SAM-dependent MidA family methyltransferase
VEVGAGLRERQAAALDELSAAGWDVGWGVNLDSACVGVRSVVVVGNEFLDSLPVHLVQAGQAALREVYVTNGPSGLGQTWGDLSDEAAAEIERLFGTLDPLRLRGLGDDGFLEVRPGVGGLMRQVARVMPSGSLVNIDYGEWFPPLPACCQLQGAERASRRGRTIRGYFKGQMVMDPLKRAGGQDLTADVDFSAVDLHGRREGFEMVLFTSLAAFLRAGGAEQEVHHLHTRAADAQADLLEADRQATVLANLLDQQDLGGIFKVMVQTKE